MGEKQALLALAIGFVAFSVPLLYQDTKHIWQAPPPPPPPPEYPSYTYPEEDDKDAKFRRACTDGNLAEAEAVLKEFGPEVVTKAHWHGNTPIFEAARAGQLAMVRWLIEHGAKPDEKNEWGDAPVNEAATMGHFDVVWFLAEKGADLKAPHKDHVGGGHNALILSAVRHRSVEALQKLKEHDVDLDTRHWNGNSALHEAARSGEKEIVAWLVKSGANISAINDSGEGPVAEAASMGHFDVLWLLLEAGADVGEPGSSTLNNLVMSAVRHSNTALLDHLQAHMLKAHGAPLDVNVVELHGNTALVEAARNGDAAVLDWLLRHGANATAHAEHGETPLQTAAFSGHFELMWRLHEAGAPLNGTNENGGSVLMSAVFHENEAEVARLIGHGLDADHSNERGDTPLSVAASKGNVGIMRQLLRHGAVCKGRGRRADTPLMRAARFRKTEAARLLLEEQHVDVNVHNRRGDTALTEAARVGKVELAELLLQHGATVEHANKKGMTAFLEAADGGNLPMLKMLHAQHADVHKVSSNGEGALELAKWARDSDDIAEWLKSVGVKPQEGHEHDDHEEAPHEYD